MDAENISNNGDIDQIGDEELESDNESSSEEVMGSDQNSEDEQVEDDDTDGARKRVFIPGQKLPKGTQLVPDESAYIMRHEFGFHPLPSSLSWKVGNFIINHRLLRVHMDRRFFLLLQTMK